MAPRKVDFALAVRNTATKLAQVMDEIDALAGIYTASGYNSGGSNPITDADLEGHDMTAAQLGQFATLAANLVKFMDNETPAKANYRTPLNAFRNV